MVITLIFLAVSVGLGLVGGYNLASTVISSVVFFVLFIGIRTIIETIIRFFRPSADSKSEPELTEKISAYCNRSENC
jgi:predicted RND superfamily exporter protein